MRASDLEKKPLFIFCTLEDRSILSKVLGHNDFEYQPATLSAFTRSHGIVNGQAYPTIVKTGNRQDKVHGYVVELSSDDLKKIDAWEENYARNQVPVAVNGQLITAYAYATFLG